MRIEGLWFHEADQIKMLRKIRENIPLMKDQRQIMFLVKKAFDESGGKGLSGESDATATVEGNGYQVIADVCCGGQANVVINKISTILP